MSTTTDTRLRVCAVALLVAPGLTLVADLVQASPAAHDTASEPVSSTQ